MNNNIVDVTKIANSLIGQKIHGAKGDAQIILVNCGNNRIKLQLANQQVFCKADDLLDGTWSLSTTVQDALEEIVEISKRRAAKSANADKTKCHAKTAPQQEVPITGNSSKMRAAESTNTDKTKCHAKAALRKDVLFKGCLLLLAKGVELKKQNISMSTLYNNYTQVPPAKTANIFYDCNTSKRNIQIAKAVDQYKKSNKQPVEGLLIYQKNAYSPWVIGATVKLQSLQNSRMTFTVKKVFQCNVPALGYLSSSRFKFGPIDRKGKLVEGAISYLDPNTYNIMVQNASQGIAQRNTSTAA